MEDERETRLIGDSMVLGQMAEFCDRFQIPAESVFVIQVSDWMALPQRVRTSQAKLTIILTSLSTHVQTTSKQYVLKSC